MKKHDLRTPDYLGHILEAIRRIRSYTEGHSAQSLQDTPMALDAVVRNLKIIGEAAHNVEQGDPAFAASHPEIRWRTLHAMRNQISHGYFAVDVEIIWSTLKQHLPVLERDLIRLIGE
ncbi:DUF86 domain-containing protein [Paraburkholderia sp. B3]|uniref:HepT-like ribonuclease domain-containing protein n=1 Tax=Paraburkholderia sp. B3 TaxID=3134791 RepID=UPI003982BB20